MASKSLILDSSPEKVARLYEERRIAGDLAQVPPLLTADDQLALSSGRAQLAHAGLRDAGLPSGVFDSVRVLTISSDTATIAAFLTGPNVQSLMASAFQSAIAGTLDTNRAAIQKMVANAPRVTLIDTVRLVREAGQWRVLLSLDARRAVAEATDRLGAAYRDDDVSAAAEAGQQLLAVAAANPRLVDSDDLSRARDAIRARPLLDSVRAELAVEESMFGSWIRGSVVNTSGAKIVDAVIRLTDTANETRDITVRDLAPGQKRRVFEMAGGLAQGNPARIEIVWVNLGAWEKRIF